MKSSIFNIFAESPIKPMQHHMDRIYSCASELIKFFTSVLEDDWENAEYYYKNISNLEAEGDELKKDIRLHFPRSLFLPVSRGDLLWMLNQQDKIANKSKHIAGLVYGRKTSIPESIKVEFMQFIKKGVEATALAQKAINELDKLVETGFRGAEANLVEQIVIELDQVERDTDAMQMDLRQKLFALEAELNPVDVIFLYRIIDWSAELADRAQNIGQRLESLLASD